MIKRILNGIWISIACVAVMLLTAFLIVVFYIASFFRKIFYKDYVPNYLKGTIDENDEDLIGSANAQVHAVQAMLDKKEPST